MDIGEVDATEGGNTTGTLVSGDFEQYAATLTTPSISGDDEKQNIRNMKMNVNPHSAIYGASGAAGGGDGGGALHLNVGSANRHFVFSIKDDGKVYAGGGGGSQGSSTSDRSIECSVRDNRWTVRNTFFAERREEVAGRAGSLSYSVPGRRCRRSGKGRKTPVPGPGPGYTVTQEGQLRNFTGGRGRGTVCSQTYTILYDPTRNTEPAYYRDETSESRSTLTKRAFAAGGRGGAGGAGQGWFGDSTGSVQAAQNGSPGGAGSSASCEDSPRFTFGPNSFSQDQRSKTGQNKDYRGTPRSTSTSPGGDGKKGGTWGKNGEGDSGFGEAGTAILHNGFTNLTSKFVGTGNDAKLKGRFTS